MGIIFHINNEGNFLSVYTFLLKQIYEFSTLKCFDVPAIQKAK